MVFSENSTSDKCGKPLRGSRRSLLPLYGAVDGPTVVKHYRVWKDVLLVAVIYPALLSVRFGAMNRACDGPGRGGIEPGRGPNLSIVP